MIKSKRKFNEKWDKLKETHIILTKVWEKFAVLKAQKERYKLETRSTNKIVKKIKQF